MIVTCDWPCENERCHSGICVTLYVLQTRFLWKTLNRSHEKRSCKYHMTQVYWALHFARESCPRLAAYSIDSVVLLLEHPAALSEEHAFYVFL